jgi:hypothetical protein
MRARFPSAHGRAVGKPHRSDAHPPQAGAAFGSPFFWLLFFGEAKKSDSAAAEADETWRQHHPQRENQGRSRTPAFAKKTKVRAAEQAPLYDCFAKSSKSAAAEDRTPEWPEGQDRERPEADESRRRTTNRESSDHHARDLSFRRRFASRRVLAKRARCLSTRKQANAIASRRDAATPYNPINGVSDVNASFGPPTCRNVCW